MKFTPAGGRVAVRTRRLAAGRDAGGRPWLILEVTDTGIGIEPDALPRIFDAFEQGEARRPARSGGLGLGLAICRGIVEAHGGRIAASSDGEGPGATFRVELATVPAPAIPEPSVVPTDACTARPALRVLLVEDNADIARGRLSAPARKGSRSRRRATSAPRSRWPARATSTSWSATSAFPTGPAWS